MIASEPIPRFAFYERLVMRVLFAWIVWRATPAALVVNGIPAPNGIARVMDLHFLLEPHSFALLQMLLAAALIAYVLRLFVFLSLPIALFANVTATAIVNSQGAIQHAFQIVSLVLLAQTTAHFYGLWCRRSGDAGEALEDRTIWWSQQTIVAVYLVAGITKVLVTKGLWPFQARWIGVSITKSAYQMFYDTLSQADLRQQLAVANFAAAHGWLIALLAAFGLLLELGSPLALINRTWAASIGLALIGFHVSLDYAMRLSFIYNQWLLLIFLVNLPYWMMTAFRRFVRRKRAVAP